MNEIMPVSLSEMLEFSSRTHNSRPFLNTEDGSISYNDFLDLVRKRALELQGMGLKPGTAAGIYHSEKLPILLDLFAISMANSTPVLMSHRWNGEQIARSLQKCSARFLSYSKSLDSNLEPVWSVIQSLDGLITENQSWKDSEEKSPGESQSASDSHGAFSSEKQATPGMPGDRLPAIIAFTAGTENQPKPIGFGCGLWKRARDLAVFLELDSRDELLLWDELSSIHNVVSFALSAMNAGASLRTSGNSNRSTVLFACSKSINSYLNRGSTDVQSSSQLEEELSVDPESLNKVVISGNGPSPESYARIKENGWVLYRGYHVTELAGIVSLVKSPGKFSSCGQALPGTEIRIGSLQTDSSVSSRTKPSSYSVLAPDSPSFQEAKAGQIGDIWIRSIDLESNLNVETNPTSYESAVEDFAEDRERWFRTEDLGYLKEGQLFFHCRSWDRIRRNDIDVFATEIEQAMLSYPEIQEVAVIGIPDAKMGQEILAFVRMVETTSMDVSELKNRLRNQLPVESVPGKIVNVANFPRSSHLAIQKKRMAEDYLRNQKLLNRIPGKVDIEYRWVYGKALTRFYTGLKNEEKIFGTRCPECKKIQVPPKIYCGICFVECTEYIEVPRTGVLESFTTVHLEYPGQPRKPPYTYGYIKLDGTNTHLYHLVDGLKVDDIRTGLRVEAVWKPREQRAGTLYDIEYFQPIEGGVSATANG